MRLQRGGDGRRERMANSASCSKRILRRNLHYNATALTVGSINSRSRQAKEFVTKSTCKSRVSTSSQHSRHLSWRFEEFEANVGESRKHKRQFTIVHHEEREYCIFYCRLSGGVCFVNRTDRPGWGEIYCRDIDRSRGTNERTITSRN